MSGKERVLRDLSSGQWVCASVWLSSYLYVYSQRVSQINADEKDRIESRPCQQHDHKVYEYRDTFALKPAQLSWQAA